MNSTNAETRLCQVLQHSAQLGPDTNFQHSIKQTIGLTLQHDKMELTEGCELWSLPRTQWKMTKACHLFEKQQQTACV